MASRRDHTDVFSVIQQGRRRMRHPEKRRRNSTPFGQAPGSGARPLARTALQRSHRAGVRKLDPAFHPSQRQAASEADGAGGGLGLPDPAGDRRAGVCGDAELSIGSAVISLSRGSAHRAAVDGKSGACQATEAHSCGALARRGMYACLSTFAGSSRPASPCPAPHPYPHWSPATRTPSTPW